MPSLITDPISQLQQGAAQASAIGAQQNQQNMMNAILQQYLGTAGSPSSTMSGAMGMVQPLSTGNIENIQNQTAANVAEHGFSQAPNIWQNALSNALGSAQVSLQNQGLQNYQASQQLPLSVPQQSVSGYSQQSISDPISSGIASGVGSYIGSALL